MTWGFASFETRFRWAAALWAVLMTVWCMSPLPWGVRAVGGAVWVAITVAASARFAWWRPRLPREVPICLLAEVDPGTLEPLVRNLLASGYRFQTVGEALERPLRKSVVLTFDGGGREQFTVLLPLLLRLGVKATCFVSDQGMRDAGHLKPLELQEMARSGLIELGGALPDGAGEGEALLAAVVRGRRWLTGVTGRLPEAFAYAPGPGAALLARAAEAAHYRVAMTVGARTEPFARAPFAVARRPLPPGLRPWQAYLLATRGRYRW